MREGNDAAVSACEAQSGDKSGDYRGDGGVHRNGFVRFCTIFRTKSCLDKRKSGVLCDFSYKTPDCCAISGHFVRFFIQNARLLCDQRPFCTIFHIKRPIAVRSAAILYDFSYKTPDSGARSGHFVRFFIQNARLLCDQRPFCAIFHTKHPILAHAAAILYDFSYKTPDSGACSGSVPSSGVKSISTA
jgi:hypothetical protein